MIKKTTEPVGPGSIIGSWQESNAAASLVLTTKSNQTATNFLNSTGEIAITGDYNAKLSLLIEIPEDDEFDGLLVAANPTGFLGFADTSFLLELDPTMNDTEGTLAVGVDDDSDFEDELYNPVNYTYSGTALNISNSQLESDDTHASVTIAGNISYPQVNISANTPSTLNFNSDQFYEFGNTITTFSDDNTFISSEDTGLGDSTGTWMIVGDTLKITTSQEVEDPVSGELTFVDTTITPAYVNTGNQFKISNHFDLCEALAGDGEDDLSCEDILNLLELFLKLDENSLTKAEVNVTLIFDKIADGSVVKISSNSEDSRSNSIPRNLVEFLINTKKSIQSVH